MQIRTRHILGFALALLALSARAQELSPDVLTVARAVNTNRDLLKRLPLYTCLETIGRERPREHGHSSAHDVVQVDVGVAEKTELYSWPDDARFSSLNLPDLVAHGLLSTGMFISFAHDLFVVNQDVVKLTGKDVIQGRDAFHLTYRVPSLANRWTINWRGRTGELQETGEFWVDALDYHLLKLRVVAQDIPPLMLLRSITLDIDYQLVQRDSDSMLLPMGGVLTVVDNAGKPYRNTVAFSHCHVFAAESKMYASDEVEAAALTQYKQQEAVLPPGLILPVTLDEPVLAKSARVGDLISARLTSAVRCSPELEIPSGALLKGRIREFTLLDDPPDTYMVAFEFSELNLGDRSFRFFADLVDTASIPGIQFRVVQSRVTGLRSFAGGMEMTSNETTPAYVIPGTAVFYLQGTTAVPKGFQMRWRTTHVSR